MENSDRKDIQERLDHIARLKQVHTPVVNNVGLRKEPDLNNMSFSITSSVVVYMGMLFLFLVFYFSFKGYSLDYLLIGFFVFYVVYKLYKQMRRKVLT